MITNEAKTTSRNNTMQAINDLGLELKQTHTVAGGMARATIGIGQWRKAHKTDYKTYYPSANNLKQAYKLYCEEVGETLLDSLKSDKDLLVNRISVSKTGRVSIGAIRPSLTPSLQASKAKARKGKAKAKAPTPEDLATIEAGLNEAQSVEFESLAGSGRVVEAVELLKDLWREAQKAA